VVPSAGSLLNWPCGNDYRHHSTSKDVEDEVQDALRNANIEFDEDLTEPSLTLVVANGAKIVFDDASAFYAVYFSTTQKAKES
jgi:hypothetical protein